MKTSSFFLACFALFIASCSPKTATITYHISTTKPLKANETVYIAGSHANLGDWQPNKIAFKRENDTVFNAKIQLPRGKSFEYKFTHGNWNNEQTLGNGTIPANQFINIRKDTNINIKISNWKDEFFKPKGQVTGKIQHIKQWKGEGIEPRDVHIWFPPNYDSTGKTNYAVVYCHDGQNVFDPATASFGIDWQLDETADSLIRNGSCRAFLMVAMDCTKNRTAEYAYEATAENYQKWVVNQVKPYIDAHFPTLKDAKNTAILGSSMGGLCAFELAWNYPNVFGHAACFSPAFRIKKTENAKVYDLDYIVLAQNATDFKNIDLYIDNGTVDLDARLQPGINDMMQFLTARKQAFTWYLAKGEPHNEAAWARRAWRPFLQFFANKK